MVSNSNFVTTILQSEVRTIPLVFVSVSDPIGSGFVQDLARPGGNITGFANFQPTIGGKWLEKLHEVAPQVQNVGLVMHPEPPNFGYLKSAEAAGAAGNIAAEAVVKAPPDGYTLLQVGTPNAINATLYAGHCGAGAVL
jgi:putative tryptophan/tyrosine transport system substrate-binding protein